MAKGTWSASDVNGQLVPANRDRSGLVIDHHSGDEVFLGFGEDGAVDTGVSVKVDKDVALSGRTARMAVYGICASGNSASGGYQETYE